MKPIHVALIRTLIVECIDFNREELEKAVEKYNCLRRQQKRERNAMARQRLESAIANTQSAGQIAADSHNLYVSALNDYDSMFEIDATTVGALSPTFPTGIKETHINVGGVVYRDVYVPNAMAKER